MRKRAQFVAVRKGHVHHTRPFVLTARERNDDLNHIGLGFTVSKANGNAVVRNRIKRRLKHAIKSIQGQTARQGCDYVIIAKPECLTTKFSELVEQLRRGFGKIGDKLSIPH